MARAAKTKQVAHKPHHKWDDETRNAVITDYAHTGNMSLTQQHYSQVSYDTIRGMVESDHGVALIADLHNVKATEHRQAYSRLVDKSLRAAEAGIDGLDISTLKANDIKALMVTGATGTDKIRLADNMPGSISGSSDVAAMQQMADLFASMSSRNKDNEDKIKAIEDTIVSDQ